MNKLTIVFPLPRQDEHPNARPYWRTKAKSVKSTRNVATLITRHVMTANRIRGPISKPCYKVKFWLNRKRDEDGLVAWLKSTIDGIATAGLINNDNDFKLISVEQLSGRLITGGRIGVEFTIWSRDDE
jgi:Holliday junction resolvase RusA-like endonuclease